MQDVGNSGLVVLSTWRRVVLVVGVVLMVVVAIGAYAGHWSAPVAFALLGLGLLVICVGKWPRVRPGRRLIRVVAAFGVVAVGGLLGARAIGLELALALAVLAGIATAATDRPIVKPPRP